jgi:uncharacterized protein YndB with AHSA1/START domain
VAARGNDRTSLERTSDKELRITRTFPAPARVVFDAYTRPEHVKRWWAPASRGVTLAECNADVRPGGTYRYVLASGKDVIAAFSGRYLEVEPPARLVYTQVFEMFPGAEATITVTFEERDGVTTLVAKEVYPSKEALDGALASGVEEGAKESVEQLGKLVASLRG